MIISPAAVAILMWVALLWFVLFLLEEFSESYACTRVSVEPDQEPRL